MAPCVEALVNAKANLDVQANTDDATALMLTVRHYDFNYSMANVQLLVAARADLALQDHSGMTALIWAIR